MLCIIFLCCISQVVHLARLLEPQLEDCSYFEHLVVGSSVLPFEVLHEEVSAVDVPLQGIRVVLVFLVHLAV